MTDREEAMALLTAFKPLAGLKMIDFRTVLGRVAAAYGVVLAPLPGRPITRDPGH